MFNHLDNWLAYLEKLHPKTIDLGLERINQVANALQLFLFKPFVITVAGTNGKGSCVALTENILLQAGNRVGTYTSPHLLKYNERIRVNGKEVSDAMLCEAFAVIEKARATISLSYFEFGTLAALWLFKQAQLDVVVLEVGMGGRLDATNVMDADIAIISSIALDHVEWLGNTREAIGFEKAGIMRSGKPCVCGDFAVPQSIRQHAEQLGSQLYCQNEAFGYEQVGETWNWWSQTKKLNGLPLPKIDLQNAATVLQAVHLLPDTFKINQQVLEDSLQQVFLPGRFQTISGKITTILDVAHNPASATLLAKNLPTSVGEGKTLAVVGMLSDKDRIGTLQPLLSKIDAWYVGSLDVARGASAGVLLEALQQLGVENKQGELSVTLAYQQALVSAKPGDRIVVFGSFYTVAEVMMLTL
jgi:dihydrofolate synthase/folylpolyglutamate synthase